jgi:hypothetical protein
MRLIMMCVAAGALYAAAAVAQVDPASLAVTLQAQTPAPTAGGTETTAATWATMLWIAVGLVFLLLLVGAILLGVRSTGDRAPTWWKRRTRE